MGLIRGALFTVVAILLFISLLFMNTFWTISKSLDYDVIKVELVPVVTNIIIEQTEVLQNFDNNGEFMQIYCQNYSTFNFTVQDITLDIPCTNILEGSDSIVNYLVSRIIEQKYYQEYNCKFWQCPMDPPYHLVSQKAQVYWSEWFYVFLIISLVLIVIDFFLIKNKNDYPIILGGLLIISSLLFAKIDWILSFMGDWQFIDIVAAFFSQAYSVFLIDFVLGIILILLGVALKFLGLGEWLLNILSIKKKD